MITMDLYSKYHLSQILPILFFICWFCACQEQTTKPAKDIWAFNLIFQDSIQIDDKVRMRLLSTSRDSTQLYSGKIERRGSSSIGFDKHSYEIDLSKDVPLGKLPTDDDWILNANYIDKTFMRHVFAYDLFRDMHPNNVAPKTTYVELSLNHQYQGLYVLMEKLDKSTLGIEDQDEVAVIFKEPPLFRLGEYTPQNPKNYYQQTFPKKKKDDRTAFIAGVQNFITNSESSIFSNEIKAIFDMQSVIDWHLLLLLTNNNDGILKNFYLYKINGTTAIRFAPWDYDHSLGRDGDNKLNMIRPLKIERSTLLQRLLTLDWYKAALKKRWTELNQQGIFSLATLQQRINHYEAILKPMVEKNFEKWPVNSRHYYDDNDFATEVTIIRQYLDLRHAQLQEYFQEF